MRCDAAIVGGGAAGNMAAYLLSKKGYKIVVLEKNKSIGNKVCGGLVSKRVTDLTKTEFVVNEIKGAQIHFPDGRNICIGGDKTHAYVLDRNRFDQELAEKAMAEGAQYKLGVRVKRIGKNSIEGRENIVFKYLIGADGAKSIIAQRFNMGNSKYINTIQGRAISGNGEDFVRIYLDVNMAPGFFSWVIPDGTGSRVGLGTRERGIRQILAGKV